ASLGGAPLGAAVEALLERGAGPEEWRKLGPAAVAPLETIAREARTPPRRRQDAIRSLGALEGIPEAAAPLRQIAADPPAPDADRCRAALALAQLQGPAAVAELEPLLQDPRDSLRAGAARAQGPAGSDDARRISTFTVVEVTEASKGAPGKRLTVRQPGGEVGGIGQSVAGAARFAPGEEVVLFLERARDDATVFQVLSMSAGKVRLEMK